ncbi:hypothetical protein EAE96_005896 [Botrytis aclada]|nr:hypothetical protein EAE96_005896 [Botrytis aclada]
MNIFQYIKTLLRQIPDFKGGKKTLYLSQILVKRKGKKRKRCLSKLYSVHLASYPLDPHHGTAETPSSDEYERGKLSQKTTSGKHNSNAITLPP